VRERTRVSASQSRGRASTDRRCRGAACVRLLVCLGFFRPPRLLRLAWCGDWTGRHRRLEQVFLDWCIQRHAQLTNVVFPMAFGGERGVGTGPWWNSLRACSVSGVAVGGVGFAAAGAQLIIILMPIPILTHPHPLNSSSLSLSCSWSSTASQCRLGWFPAQPRKSRLAKFCSLCHGR
jgi:hypothetical protein